MVGSDIRATPPSLRMSAGTRSSAITAQAPASSAIFACAASVTSMITPPLSISASPLLTRKVASSRMRGSLNRLLLQLEGADPLLIARLVIGVDGICERLDQRQQRRVGPRVRGAVGGVVQAVVRQLRELRDA